MLFTIGKIAFWCGLVITLSAVAVNVFVVLNYFLKWFLLPIPVDSLVNYSFNTILIGLSICLFGIVLRGFSSGNKGKLLTK